MNRGPTEIGGFATTSVDDPLLVEEFLLVRQHCTAITVAFDDQAVADFYDRQIDLGRKPEQFGRIWIHTHPGDCARPSHLDEKTFDRVFGTCHWAVMAIVARGGQSYARLRFNHGPQADLRIAIEVDYSKEFEGSDWQLWNAEYDECVVNDSAVMANVRKDKDRLLADPFFATDDPTAESMLFGPHPLLERIVDR